jgi:hypothetical protein
MRNALVNAGTTPLGYACGLESHVAAWQVGRVSDHMVHSTPQPPSRQHVAADRARLAKSDAFATCAC